ncbi:MAG: DUF2281 domain-containing protein [Alphaproteobacteria bacterium]|nr:DUF2281 domain-containing protein [Alphaproteobacteria bacterium]
MTLAELVYEQTKKLPEPLAREVLDFIAYLRDRPEREAWRDLAKAQSAALNTVWDNPEDRIWDRV